MRQARRTPRPTSVVPTRPSTSRTSCASGARPSPRPTGTVRRASAAGNGAGMESEQESGEEAAGGGGGEVEDAVQEMDSDLAGMEDSAGDVDADIDETRSD